jgi:hypothetical protein
VILTYIVRGLRKTNILSKTLTAGVVYGHKIKAKFNFYGYAKTQLHLLSIGKEVFDQMIIHINTRKENFKTNFLKKFFLKIRMYTDDIFSSMKVYFIREEYHKNSRVYVDGDFDEYVYIVISGSIAAVKAVTKIKNLKEKLAAIYENMPKYVILEKISKHIIKIGRGDIFGVYSALKHRKIIIR